MTQFVHEATVELADGADPRAIGGAITVALCGHWDHQPPCRWPHHTDISTAGDHHLVEPRSHRPGRRGDRPAEDRRRPRNRANKPARTAGSADGPSARARTELERTIEKPHTAYTRHPVATTVAADPLAPFTPAVRAWFEATFEAPTQAQSRAGRRSPGGEHTLIHAPTGSGKTLAAFLYTLDRLARASPAPRPTRHVRVLYISPLKALTYDVERNLRAPLTGIGLAARAWARRRRRSAWRRDG